MSKFLKVTPKVSSIPNRKIMDGKARHRAELWDQMQLFFQKYNDHQLHCAIFFEKQLDFELIKKSVLFTMRILPLLNSRFVEDYVFPYWENMNLIIDDTITFVDNNNVTEEIDSFLTGKTDEFKGPQLRVRIVRNVGKDTLCIVMNHMICDGAGFKEYLYLLGSIYTNLRRDPTYEPEYKEGGSRSSSQILRQVKLSDKLRMLFMPNHLQKHKIQHFFPLSGDCVTSPSILSFKLNSDQFLKLKEYGRKQGATINDIVLAAYIRVLYKVIDIKTDNSIPISCMVDLRRFLPDKKAEAICNLTSTIICDIDFKLGESFDETVTKIKQVMDEQKSKYPGLNGLFMLSVIFKLFPYKIVKKLIGKFFVNPSIALSNIGIIDESRLIFDNINVEDAFITGGIKYYPYFLLALTSFHNSITFTISLHGAEKDRQQVELFFRLLNNEFEQQITL